MELDEISIKAAIALVAAFGSVSGRACAFLWVHLPLTVVGQSGDLVKRKWHAVVLGAIAVLAVLVPARARSAEGRLMSSRVAYS